MREKTELMKYMGSMQQAAYVRPLTFAEGRSTGLKAWEVKNGQLSYKVLADKCLDVGERSYRGVNFSFLSKPGLQGRNHYDTAGDEAIRSIMGGMFFTAGLESICAPCTIDGVDYPMLLPGNSVFSFFRSFLLGFLFFLFFFFLLIFHDLPF